jgi:hypothetical protein
MSLNLMVEMTAMNRAQLRKDQMSYLEKSRLVFSQSGTAGFQPQQRRPSTLPRGIVRPGPHHQ